MKTNSAPYPYLPKFALYLKNPQLAQLQARLDEAQTALQELLAQFPPNAEALTNADAIATNAKLKIPTVTTLVVPLEAIKDKLEHHWTSFHEAGGGGLQSLAVKMQTAPPASDNKRYSRGYYWLYTEHDASGYGC